jgi:hypothetical protein
MNLALLMARKALAETDDAACNKGWDDLLARFGYEEASRAWKQACKEMDGDQ